MPKNFQRKFSGVGAGVVLIRRSDCDQLPCHRGRARNQRNAPRRRKLKAEVVGIDNLTDLAVLRVETTGKFLMHSSATRKMFESATGRLRFGDPFGLSKSVSLGIVSAMGRNLLVNSPGVPLIQVDAAGQPGKFRWSAV